MKYLIVGVVLAVLQLASGCEKQQGEEQVQTQTRKPNILLIVADALG